MKKKRNIWGNINGKMVLLLMVSFAMIFLAACGGSGSDAASDSDTSSEGEDHSSFPENNIEIIVGWGAGGGTDNFTRAIAKELSDILDVNINVVNREGASGANGGDYVLSQPADGYTIWAMTSNYPINVADGKTPHGLEKYTPIGRVQTDTLALQVKTDNFKDYNDFLEKAEANPGEITIGGTGARGFDEVILRQIEEKTDLEFNYIPYESAGEMHAAVLGGHIDGMLEELGPTVSQLEDGALEMLLAFTDEELKGYEDVPLSVDEGIDILDGMNRGLMVSSDTPDEIVSILEKALEEAKDKEDFLQYEEDSYLNLREGWLNSNDYKEHLESDINKYEEIMAGLE